MADPPAFLKKAGDMMVHFVDAFIEFDKVTFIEPTQTNKAKFSALPISGKSVDARFSFDCVIADKRRRRASIDSSFSVTTVGLKTSGDKIDCFYESDTFFPALIQFHPINIFTTMSVTSL